jgi:hypothetical protein
MDRLRFLSPDGTDIAPEEWLRVWSSLYGVDDEDDEVEYRALIAKDGAFSRTDFERIGRWKDNAVSDGRWKPNVAMVAYKIWMQATSELPRCPGGNAVAAFLDDWSERKYQDKYKSGLVREKRFGLARATTLLHFISGGRFPIFDARVRRAASRLLNSRARNTVRWYLDSFCQIFSEIASACGTKDLRSIDRALFCYGDRTRRCSNWPSTGS